MAPPASVNSAAEIRDGKETITDVASAGERGLSSARVYIPKGRGQHPIGMPAVKGRVVQAALMLLIEPVFEHEFEPGSFGFRQALGCKDALREMDRHLEAGYFWVIDADLQSYFDTI